MKNKIILATIGFVVMMPSILVQSNILLPNNGDGNGDGIKDIEQENVQTIQSPNKTSFVTAVFDSQDPNCRITQNISTIEGNNDKFQYPFGLVNYKLKCNKSTELTLIWHGAKYSKKENYKLRRFGNIIPSSQPPQEFFEANGVFEGKSINNEQILTTKLIITDGQYGDQTPKDGFIIDSIGLIQTKDVNSTEDDLIRTGGNYIEPSNIILALIITLSTVSVLTSTSQILQKQNKT